MPCRGLRGFPLSARNLLTHERFRTVLLSGEAKGSRTRSGFVSTPGSEREEVRSALSYIRLTGVRDLKLPGGSGS
jgi:hypothetical protein